MPRPSKPLISRRKAAEVALDIIDQDGLDNLSLAKVAHRLGVKSPSLYYHFRDKDELLAEVARLLLIKIPELAPGQGPLEEWIVQLCVSTRRGILEHPFAAPLLLQFFPRHLLLAAYESSASMYDYPVEYRLAVMEGTEKLTFGSALFAAAARAAGRPAMPPVDTQTLPALSLAITRSPFDDETLFVESLRMFLAGARTRIADGNTGKPIER